MRKAFNPLTWPRLDKVTFVLTIPISAVLFMLMHYFSTDRDGFGTYLEHPIKSNALIAFVVGILVGVFMGFVQEGAPEEPDEEEGDYRP